MMMISNVGVTPYLHSGENDSCPSQTVFTGLDHHQKDNVFSTCGQQVDIWDEQRTSPIRSFTWGVDSFSCVRYNPVEVRLSVLSV